MLQRTAGHMFAKFQCQVCVSTLSIRVQRDMSVGPRMPFLSGPIPKYEKGCLLALTWLPGNIYKQ